MKWAGWEVSQGGRPNPQDWKEGTESFWGPMVLLSQWRCRKITQLPQRGPQSRPRRGWHCPLQGMLGDPSVEGAAGGWGKPTGVERNMGKTEWLPSANCPVWEEEHSQMQVRRGMEDTQEGGA